MRTAFIEQLTKEAEHNEKIFLLVGDLGFSVVESFAQKFPERFLNVGIAEQNMTGIAAGLAMEGYNVFTYSIANFPTLRCMEQIRYDVCYHNLSVKIVSVGGGYAYGPLGVSHHATEEIGMLRTIPNISICAPADPYETKTITSLLCNNDKPGYLRLGKSNEPVVHLKPITPDWGKMIRLINGKETVVLSTGGMLNYSNNYIHTNGKKWGLYSVPFIKPLDSDTLSVLANSYDNFITIEEHQASGGFGSAILESLNDLHNSGILKNLPKVKRIAIPDIFISSSGTQEYLRKEAGLFF